MADKKNGGVMYNNPYNGTNGGPGPEDPDISGGGIYHSYDEVLSMSLSQEGASLLESPNVRSGHGIFGGPAAGEPNPYGFSPTSEGDKK